MGQMVTWHSDGLMSVTCTLHGRQDGSLSSLDISWHAPKVGDRNIGCLTPYGATRVEMLRLLKKLYTRPVHALHSSANGISGEELGNCRSPEQNAQRAYPRRRRTQRRSPWIKCAHARCSLACSWRWARPFAASRPQLFHHMVATSEWRPQQTGRCDLAAASPTVPVLMRLRWDVLHRGGGSHPTGILRQDCMRAKMGAVSVTPTA